jgi:hypothetical protein
VLSRSQYGTITGTTHKKTLFNSSPVIGKHFIDNSLSSSDDCHAIHSYLAPFHDKERPLQTQRRKYAEESNAENEGTSEWAPFFQSNDQETPCPERREYELEVSWCTI